MNGIKIKNKCNQKQFYFQGINAFQEMNGMISEGENRRHNTFSSAMARGAGFLIF